MQAVTEEVQPLRPSLPEAWNFSRILKQLSQLEADTGRVSEMIVTLRHQLTKDKDLTIFLNGTIFSIASEMSRQASQLRVNPLIAQSLFLP